MGPIMGAASHILSRSRAYWRLRRSIIALMRGGFKLDWASHLIGDDDDAKAAVIRRLCIFIRMLCIHDSAHDSLYTGCLGPFQVAQLLHLQALHNDSTHDSMYAKLAVLVIRTIKKIDGPQAWANDYGFKCQILKSSKINWVRWIKWGMLINMYF
jgi:hypothetical protein